MGDEIAVTVNGLINSDKIVIFSKTTCPFCDQAKELFDSLGCKFTTYELNNISNGSTIQDCLGKMTGARTVPRVFIKGKCIGGAMDAAKLHKNGGLKPLLE